MKTRHNGFQKGVALPFVIIIFVIVTTIVGIMYSFFSVNLKQTIYQEKNIQAYYCTLTGIEMATAALLMDNPSYLNDIDTPFVPKTLLEAFQSDHSKTLSDTIYLPDGKSSATLTISVQTKQPDLSLKWIRVEAEGTYVDDGGKAYTNKGSVWRRLDNPAVYVQDLNN